ncbi:MAG: F420-0--gamma-glutamyl ligase [bacterium]|nr:F420-0--gamma-glutamyl ligase [bacterium]
MAEKKKLEPIIEVDGKKYERIPVATHMIHIKEPYFPLLEKYVLPKTKKGDWLALSERVIAYSQGRVVHESVVKPSWLAKIIVKGVTKFPDDLGFSHPRKMQVAIMQAGTARIIFASIVGAITRLFGRRGDFYRIAGNNIAQIDGFNPPTMAPYNEFAKLAPEDPDGFCQQIEEKYGLPSIIVDANNIDCEVLGFSKGFPITKEIARKILLDNPLGQSNELTPIVIVREAK